MRKCSFRRLRLIAPAILIVLLGLGVTSASAAVTNVGAGLNSTCLLLDAGALQCFGRNDGGQLGAPSNSTPFFNPTPRTVDTGGAVVQLSMLGAHTCAVLNSGGLSCFGINGYGQLGRPPSPSGAFVNTMPEAVNIGAGVRQVAVGGLHTCAVLNDDSVKCFGSNEQGQLGTTENFGSSVANPIAQTVALGGAVSSIASGWAHSCALLTSGVVKCWGSNFAGEIGRDTPLNSYGNHAPDATPQAVDVGGIATSISAGGAETCVTLVGGSAKCFGDNQWGQLGSAANSIPTGFPRSTTYNPVPVSVNVGGAVQQIAVGFWRACALIAGGSVYCFGESADTLSADRSAFPTTVPTPTPVNFGGTVLNLAAGYGHVCATLVGGGFHCFGSNAYGELGRVTAIDTGAIEDLPRLRIAGLKSKTKRGKRTITGNATLSKSFINKSCKGYVKPIVKSGRKSIRISGSFKLVYKARKCQTKIKFRVPRKHNRSTLKIRGSVTWNSKRVTSRDYRVRP